jgi:hypothetical protein
MHVSCCTCCGRKERLSLNEGSEGGIYKDLGMWPRAKDEMKEEDAHTHHHQHPLYNPQSTMKHSTPHLSRDIMRDHDHRSLAPTAPFIPNTDTSSSRQIQVGTQPNPPHVSQIQSNIRQNQSVVPKP